MRISDNPTEPQQQEAPSSSTATSGEGSSSDPSPRKCAHCSKAESDPEVRPLKPCPKCHTTLYCSRDCQKAAFKQHKKTCALDAQEYAKTANLKMAAPSAPKKDGHRGGLQKWQFDT